MPLAIVTLFLDIFMCLINKTDILNLFPYRYAFVIKVTGEWRIEINGIMSNTAQKMKFSLRISSVNVTKSAVFCEFDHIY